MADKSKTHEYYVRPEKLGAWKGFTQFMWNSDTSQFMGRTSSSWGKLIKFYESLKYQQFADFWRL